MGVAMGMAMGMATGMAMGMATGMAMGMMQYATKLQYVCFKKAALIFSL